MSGDNVEKIAEEAVPLMIMIFLGWFLAHFRSAYFPAEMVGSFNRFIFNISIPCLVFKGLATRHLPDLYWEFVGVFLLLRVFFGIITWAATCLPPFRQKNIDFTADFLTNYIGTTWINTIVFGLPLLQSLYGKQVQILNILASFSSFIFQLPIMLVMFELREAHLRPEHPGGQQDLVQTLDSGSEPKTVVKILETELKHSTRGSVSDLPIPIGEGESRFAQITIFPSDGSTPRSASGDRMTISSSVMPARSTKAAPQEQPAQALRRTGVVEHHKVVGRVLLKVLRNPPFVGICAGLLWSFLIRWAGDDSTWPVYIDKWVQYFADVVTPLAAFSVGMFMNNRLKSVLVHWRQNLILIVAKMVVLPALTIPLCLMLRIDGIEGRSAVLIASLPVAVASFALGHNYMLPERWPVEILASQIVLGTILMPLVFIAWHALMDSADLFGDIPSSATYIPGK